MRLPLPFAALLFQFAACTTPDAVRLDARWRTSLGGMSGEPAPTRQTPYTEQSLRGAARIFYWYGPDSAGQCTLEHGLPAWNDSFAGFLTGPDDVRWRFGENAWTTLDTNMPLELAGVRIEPGLWYCVLANDRRRGVHLVLLDPAEVRRQRLDAYEAPKTRDGIRVPLQLGAAPAPTRRLEVRFDLDTARDDHAVLRIEFGPHALTAHVVMHPRR